MPSDLRFWSPRRDSNPRSSDYESKAFVQRVPPRPVLAAHVSGSSAEYAPDLPHYGRGMTKRMTKLTHERPKDHGDLPIGIVWMSNG